MGAEQIAKDVHVERPAAAFEAQVHQSDLAQNTVAATVIDLGEHYGRLTIRDHGNRPERQLPLNEAARRALWSYVQQPPSQQTTHVFLNRETKPLSIRSVERIVAPWGKLSDWNLGQNTSPHGCHTSTTRYRGSQTVDRALGPQVA